MKIIHCELCKASGKVLKNEIKELLKTNILPTSRIKFINDINSYIPCTNCDGTGHIICNN